MAPSSTSGPVPHSPSCQEDPRSKHPLPRESRSHYGHTPRSISNTNNIDNQHGSHHASISTPSKTSTTFSSYTESHTVETPPHSNAIREHEYSTYDYTLLGISAQFAETCEYQVPTQAIANPGPMRCPYHGLIFEYHQQDHGFVVNDLDTLSLYLNAGPSEQYALFCCPDTGMFSTVKGCSCHLSGCEPIQV